MSLTSSQQRAVNTIDKNLSVNAGAGSGKTRVLVERYINILVNGKLEKSKEVDSIVAITFTKKAQSEMKERIRTELSDRIKVNSNWKRIYEDLEKANISTIHGFCSKILMENPIEAEIYPNFGILEEYQKTKFITEILEDILINGSVKQDYIYKFLQYFTPFSIDESIHSENIITTLKNIYLKIRTTGMSIDEVKDITLKSIDNLNIDTDKIPSIKNDILYLMDNAPKNSKISKLKQDSVWLEYYNSDYTEINENILLKLSYIKDNLGRNKKLQEDIDNVKMDIDSLLKAIEKINKNIYSSVFNILIELDEKYTLKKKEVNSLDFEDLQLLTLKLLDNKDVLNYYQNKYKYIMIDEFQDTDNLQKNILYKLCSRNHSLDCNNLFVVGDPKQSIYRFRGADLSVFDEVSKDISKDSNDLLISLNDNFRTIDTVMKVINDFFINLMKDKYEILKPNKNKTSAIDIDVEILKNDDITPSEEESPSEFHKKFEGDIIARRIQQLVKNGEYNYKDIAILFRSTTSVSIYEEKLKEYGVPYTNVSGGGLLETQEVLDILNGLRVINNKYDFVSLAGFLRSPMIGISDETLYWIFKDKSKEILEALVNCEVQNKEKQKIEKAYNIIYKLNKLKNVLDINSIITELVNQTNYVETNMLLFGNTQKMANIYKFIQLAKEIQIKEKLGLREFLNHIGDLLKYGSDATQADVESADGDTVNIMTIHKSKGLQFKVVIIPETSKMFRNNKSNLLFNKLRGIGIKHPDSKGKPSKELSPIFSELSTIDNQEESEENKRILYVAMTRAEEKLILGCQIAGKNYKNSFKNMIENYIPEENIKYINNIDIEKKDIVRVKSIENQHLRTKKVNSKVFPQFNDHKYYGKKYFNSFSVSQYMTYKKCKRSFYHNYYQQKPVIKFDFQTREDENNISISPLDKGSVIHKVCELYNENNEITELIINTLKEYNLPVKENIIKEIKPYIDNYAKLSKDDLDKIYKEVQFHYNIGLSKTLGVIDRININNNEAEIIDFKTNKTNNKEYLLKEYSAQIQLYTTVVQDIYNLKVKRAGLMLLETGEFLEIDISDKSLRNNIKDIQQFIKFVEMNKKIDDYDKNKIKCEYCRHKKDCD
ncbi:UvrD-helicase domain-containing protein [Clostridium sp. D2Q-11]|uniref:DNA 3'-5' helicase n=1 Tax=Anaeromonas frigoriresistens TaxID=2683708 RepID=A0A942UTZ4_9FIRM|nr:UvrD-helicase domain-containing protein [Anaeromonas frigoriresistens]MBS4539103.1 UvrD-helicase domain-containing protein [Anaeromonas frigoriresistens]